MARQALRTGGFDLYDLPGVRGNLRNRPRPLTRVLVTIRRGRLDAALAAGADPCESPALAYRAAQLTADDNRLKLAAWIAYVLDAVEHPPRARGLAIQPHRAAVRSAGPRLEEVYERLRSSAPVYARGLAMLERLLRDGAGPVYAPRLPGELRGEVDLIAEALEGAMVQRRGTAAPATGRARYFLTESETRSSRQERRDEVMVEQQEDIAGRDLKIAFGVVGTCAVLAIVIAIVSNL